ncbi:MAG: glycosyltransferase family 2 protein [Candidatus Sulfobium sp.]|jgi:rhamnosyltransferase
MERKVCAVIVTYNTGKSVAESVAGILGQVDHLIVIDNGSEAVTIGILETLANKNSSRVSIIRNERNVGLAHALNQGVELGLSLGADWILTLDHDSYPAADMVNKMLSVYEDLSHKENVAVVAPKPVDRSATFEPSFFKFGSFKFTICCGNKRFIEPDIVITSGSMTKASVFREVGLFQSRFFIDCIDYEFCLRLRNRKYRIIVACEALLGHRLGKMSQIKFLGGRLTPTNHPPERWYYMARNRVYIYRNYWKNFWFIYLDMVSFIKEVMKVILLESNKARKVANIFRGLFDGALNRFDL